MLTLNNILQEIKDVPVSRLEELYQLVHAFTSEKKQTEIARKKILSFAGAFNDLSNDDYSEYLEQTKKTRANLFDRKIDL